MRRSRDRIDLARELFTIDELGRRGRLRLGRAVSVGLDRLVDDFDLDSLAYYHRGLERRAARAARRRHDPRLVPAHRPRHPDRRRVRAAHHASPCSSAQTIGAGGSFTEIQALNFFDDVVEMGHDGPAHLAVGARDPLLRGLGVYHGKRGYGVCVEFDVKHGPVTTFGLGQDRDGSYAFITCEGTVVPGPAARDRQHDLPRRLRRRPRRVGRRVVRRPGSATTGRSAVGHRAADIKAAASLLGIEHRHVDVAAETGSDCERRSRQVCRRGACSASASSCR